MFLLLSFGDEHRISLGKLCIYSRGAILCIAVLERKKKLLPQDLIFLILLGKPQEGRFKMIKEDKN